MNTLVAISSILTIIGFVIQVSDKFQKNREIRDRVIFTVYGFTVGVVIGLLNKTEILIQEEITFAKVMMFVALLGFLILLFIFTIGYIKDTKKTEPGNLFNNHYSDFNNCCMLDYWKL